MPRGGARPGSGPAPEAGSLREAVRIEAGLIRTLPRQRKGAAPAWPLTKATAREMVVWRRQWKRPQAVVWEEQGSIDEVGMYVRTFCEAEELGITAARRTLLLQQQNALLITHTALLAAGYRISTSAAPVATSSAAVSASTEAKRKVIPDPRRRLRAVEDVGPDS